MAWCDEVMYVLSTNSSVAIVYRCTRQAVLLGSSLFYSHGFERICQWIHFQTVIFLIDFY